LQDVLGERPIAADESGIDLAQFRRQPCEAALVVLHGGDDVGPLARGLADRPELDAEDLPFGVVIVVPSEGAVPRRLARDVRPFAAPLEGEELLR
jgi:hypothetical protein